MFCYKCGASLEDDSKFCMICGTRLIDAEASESSAPSETLPNTAPKTAELELHVQEVAVIEPAIPPVVQQAPIVEQAPVQNTISATTTSQEHTVKQLTQLTGVCDEVMERTQKVFKPKASKIASTIITIVSLLLCVGWITFSLVWLGWFYWAEQIGGPTVIFLLLLESPVVVPLAVLLVAEKIKFIIHKFSVEKKRQ